jgi:hypothetical protein
VAVADLLLRIAVQRRPAGLRDPLEREWAAELYAIRTEPGTGWWAGVVGQIAFTVSLARSWTPGGVDEADWRERLSFVGRGLRPAAVLAVAPFIGYLVAVTLRGTVGVSAMVFAGVVKDEMAVSVPVTLTVAACSILLTVAAAGVAGWWAAGWAPLVSSDSRWLRSCLAAGVVPVVLGAGQSVALAGLDPRWGVWSLVRAGFAVVVWTGLVVLLVRWTDHSMAAGRRRLAWMVTVVGGAAVICASIAGVVASVALSVDDLPRVPGVDPMLLAASPGAGLAGGLPLVLPACTAFGLLYALRTIRPAPEATTSQEIR